MGLWLGQKKNQALDLTSSQPLLLPPPRLGSLQGRLATRRLQLQASVELYQFHHLSNVELTWVAEHMPSASSCSPKSLHGAHSLLRKHKVMVPFSPFPRP